MSKIRGVIYYDNKSNKLQMEFYDGCHIFITSDKIKAIKHAKKGQDVVILKTRSGFNEVYIKNIDEEVKQIFANEYKEGHEYCYISLLELALVNKSLPEEVCYNPEDKLLGITPEYFSRLVSQIGYINKNQLHIRLKIALLGPPDR